MAKFNITPKSLRPRGVNAAEAEAAELRRRVAELERELRRAKMAKPIPTEDVDQERAENPPIPEARLEPASTFQPEPEVVPQSMTGGV